MDLVRSFSKQTKKLKKIQLLEKQTGVYASKGALRRVNEMHLSWLISVGTDAVTSDRYTN